MVTQAGMSEKLGRVRYVLEQQGDYISPETTAMIDEEIRRLIEDGEQTARRVLLEKKTEYEAIAQALLEYETLTGEELRNIMEGKDINRPDPDAPKGPRTSAVPKAGRTVLKPLEA
jgi:cell division protease FtsH